MTAATIGKCSLLLLLMGGSPGAARIARAALGANDTSVDADRQAYGATHYRKSDHPGFTVHEFSTDDIVWREYATPGGRIFAVTWHGLHHPDLRTLFGQTYLAAYSQARQAAPVTREHRPYSSVRGADLVVEKFGSMRNASGKAYLNSLMPNGVTAHDLN